MNSGDKWAVGASVAAIAIVGGYAIFDAVKSHELTITGIIIVPTPVSVPVGSSIQLSAIAKYSDGSTKDITDTATWLSRNTNIATVQAGLVRGVAPGVTDVGVNYIGMSGYGIISVTQ